MSYRYPYVGPAAILEASRGEAAGRRITSAAELRDWLICEPDALVEGATWVVGVDGALRLAPRRSEHVACAGAPEVLGAGELKFAMTGQSLTLIEASNQSTGFCPDVDCWADLAAALSFDAITLPPRLTRPIHFRRCPKCGEVNLVKEAWFVCVFCDADLPANWNVSARSLVHRVSSPSSHDLANS